MTMTYVRGPAAGDWPVGTTVTPTEFGKLDSNAFKGIDGYGGGAYAPSAPISIAGTTYLENAEFDTSYSIALTCGSLTVNGNTIIGDAAADSLTVNATTLIKNNCTIGEDASDIFAIHSSTTFNNNVAIGSSTADTFTVLSTNTLSGATSLGATPGTTGTATTLVGDLISAGAGGRVAFSTLNIADASVSTGYHYRFFASPSVLRSLDVAIPDPREGTEFNVSNIGSASLSLLIGGVLLTTLTTGTSKTIVWSDTNWRVLP